VNPQKAIEDSRKNAAIFSLKIKKHKKRGDGYHLPIPPFFCIFMGGKTPTPH